MSEILQRKIASEHVVSPGRSPDKRGGFTLLEILAVMSILSIIGVSLFTIFRQGTEVWRRSSARTEAYLKGRQILEMMAREIRGAVLITQASGPDAYQLSASPERPPFRADFRGLNGDNPGSGPPSNDPTLQGWRDSKSTYARFREQDQSDQIYFVTSMRSSGAQELCMIGYWIKDVNQDTGRPLAPSRVPRNSKDDLLMRSYLTDNKGEPSNVWRAFDFTDSMLNSSSWDVASSVRQLDIKYYDYENSGELVEYNAWDSRPQNFSWDQDRRGTTDDDEDDDRLPAAVKITVIVGDDNDVIKGIRLSTVVYLENAGRRQAL